MSSILNNLRMKYKLWTIVGCAVIGTFGIILLSSLMLKKSLLQEKRIKTRHLVETAYSVLDHYQQLSRSGGMTEELAKKAAIDAVRGLRYEEKEYFWINDMQPRMIMHPFKPELDGKDLSDFVDPKGKKLFVEFVDTVKRNKAGYVFYLWPKPGLKEPVQKLSYVKGFEPWGWIIGSGIYIDDVDAAAYAIILRFGGIGAVVIVVILLLSWMITKSIVRPLTEIGTITARIADGDLRVRINHSGRDEIGRLAETMNRMITSLNSLIGAIITSEKGVSETSQLLHARARSAVEGAQNQSGQAAQIATAAEEMSQTITDIAKNASSAAETSSSAMSIAREGKTIADGAVTTVNRVSRSTEKLSELVDGLNRKVSEIGDIVTVIKDIADQTNLLALNAAIEAARAGEQGRGFSVVADEVRKLAERTIKATAEISSKINTVQAESQVTTRSMGEAANEVNEATQYIRNVGNTLDSIVAAVRKVSDQITQIATAVEEQSAAAEDVSHNVEKTSRIARDMENMAGDVMREAQKMEGLSAGLQTATSGFKTGAES